MQIDCSLGVDSYVLGQSHRAVHASVTPDTFLFSVELLEWAPSLVGERLTFPCASICRLVISRHLVGLACDEILQLLQLELGFSDLPPTQSFYHSPAVLLERGQGIITRNPDLFTDLVLGLVAAFVCGTIGIKCLLDLGLGCINLLKGLSHIPRKLKVPFGLCPSNCASIHLVQNGVIGFAGY